MAVKITITTPFNTSLERAFKTPMLCDITRVHAGYGLMPPITHTSADETWGQIGGSRRVHMAGSLLSKADDTMLDKVLDRVDNRYWKIEVSEFPYWLLGIDSMQGEWTTTPLPDGQIEVKYTYTMVSENRLLYPLQWLFSRLIWRSYMQHVVDNIRQLAKEEAPYVHE